MDLEYPKGFPQDCQTLVEVEKIRADRDFDPAEQAQALSFTELEQRALRWVCRVLGAFAHQACELAKKGHWTLLQIGPAVEEFRLHLVRKVNYRMTDGRLSWVDRVFGTDIRPEVRHRIERSVEWRLYRDELLEVAEGCTRVLSPGAERNPSENCRLTEPPAGAVTPPVSADSQAALPTAPLKRPFNQKNPKPKRRDPKYATLDAALQQIAEARPWSHEEVFRSLEGRVSIPHAEPFVSAGGWLAGFKRNKPTARAWLSRVWYRLELPRFRRGPKQ